jgi:hypothetical protein
MITVDHDAARGSLRRTNGKEFREIPVGTTPLTHMPCARPTSEVAVAACTALCSIERGKPAQALQVRWRAAHSLARVWDSWARRADLRRATRGPCHAWREGMYPPWRDREKAAGWWQLDRLMTLYKQRRRL